MISVCRGRGCPGADTCYRIKFPTKGEAAYKEFEAGLKDGDMRCAHYIPDTRFLFNEMEVEVHA